MNTPSFASLLRDAVEKPGILSEAYSLFHEYSVGNQLWAWAQLKGRGLPLSPIATFKKWQDLGRRVRKGEKALSLVMPVTVARKDEQGEATGDFYKFFTVKNHWFALSQTEGEDFANEVKSPEWDKAQALQALGITESAFDMASGNVQGYAQGDSIAINPVAQYPHKTRFHELAHVVLGHTKEATMTDSEHTPRDTKEVEAEGVAYICCAVLSLPGLHESRGYIQSWLQGNEISDKSAQRIFGAATKILKAGKGEA
jgi:antirestriction protein ArdC